MLKSSLLQIEQNKKGHLLACSLYWKDKKVPCLLNIRDVEILSVNV